MTIALLCSGQGHQGSGMFDLVGDGPDVAPLFSHSTRWFGDDPRAWVRSASEEQLHQNAIAQVLCTLHTLAAFAQLAPFLGRRCCVAGYSVGEVAAWHVAGRIGALDALDLTVARASAMDAASTGQEGMLFVRGVNRRTLDALCAGRDAAVAITNPGDAYVLAGTADALSAIALDARQAAATRIVPVPVRVASHTSRLAAAVPAFRRALDSVSVSAGVAGRRLVSGFDGAIVLDNRGGLDRLARQIAEPVDWTACLQACDEAGASAFLELGPGRALSQMATDAYPSTPSRSIADFRSWEGVHAWIDRVMQN